MTRGCPNKIRDIAESMNYDLSRRTFVMGGKRFDCAKPPCQGTVTINTGHCDELLLFNHKTAELKTALAIHLLAETNEGELPEEATLGSLPGAFDSDHKTAIDVLSKFSKKHPVYGRTIYDNAEESRKSRGEFVPRPEMDDDIANTACRENAKTPFVEVEQSEFDRCIMHKVRDALCESDFISNEDICAAANSTSLEIPLETRQMQMKYSLNL